MKKIKIALITLMLLGLLVPTPALADGEPTYSTAVVDGNPSEWDLTNDFFADMWRAGRPPGDHPNPVLESKLYLRYDCETNTLYALVLAQEGVAVLQQPGDAWLKIPGPSPNVDGNSGNDGTPPDFEWVWVEDELRGYEASTALSEGTHILNAHIQVDHDGSQTSAVYDAELVLECQEPETGSLEVTKTVEWSGVIPDPSQTFEICISGPSYPTGTEVGACQTVGSEGGVLTWDNLALGDYTVTETEPGSVWTVTGSDVTVNVPADGPAQASVTNTHCTNELKVTKTVNWGKSAPDANQTFEICISGPSYPTGTEVGACQTVGSEGGVLTWDNLTPGDYTVTETPPQGWEVQITGSPATVECETAEASVTNTKEKPTAITMPGSSFNAEANAGRVTLTWETGTELGNAGFNLYRALLRDGPYTKVNEALLTAEGDAASGASYSFVDAPDYGTYYYRLEDVDLHGTSTLHGPVRVTVARPLRRPLYRPTLPEF